MLNKKLTYYLVDIIYSETKDLNKVLYRQILLVMQHNITIIYK